MFYPGCKALVVGSPIEENNNKTVELVKYFPPGTFLYEHELEDCIAVLTTNNPVWEIDVELVGSTSYTGEYGNIKICAVEEKYLIPLWDTDEDKVKEEALSEIL